MTKIVHTDAFTQRDANTQGCFYTRVLLHTDAFHKDMLLHRDAFHKDMLLHTNVYAYRSFYAEMILRAQLPPTHRCFTQGRFYRQELLHTDAQVLLHTDAFTQHCFYTEEFLHTCACTQEAFWHRVSFTQRSFYTNTFMRRCFYTQIHVYRSVFYTQITHRYF